MSDEEHSDSEIYYPEAGCSKDDQLKPGLVENHGTKF